MPDQITTTVEAARRLGVTPASVRALTARGTLPAGPPWTPQQLADARAHRGGSILRLNGHIPHHGAAGWAYGCRCSTCRDGHNRQVRDMRRARRVEALTPHLPTILNRLIQTHSMRQAVQGTGITEQAVWGIALWDAEVLAAIDAALQESRPDVPHGTEAGYRRGCRCAECRAAKRVVR